VHAFQLLERRARRLVVPQEIVELSLVQQVLDDVEASGLLGVARPHLVQAAGRVSDEGHGHGATRPAVTRDGPDGV